VTEGSAAPGLSRRSNVQRAPSACAVRRCPVGALRHCGDRSEPTSLASNALRRGGGAVSGRQTQSIVGPRRLAATGGSADL